MRDRTLAHPGPLIAASPTRPIAGSAAPLHTCRAVTPALTAVYDELLLRAAEEPFAERARAHRTAFERRTGVIPPDHDARAARDAASWEDALVAGGLALDVAATLDDPSERALAAMFARAQRGLFLPSRLGSHAFLRDLWGGGEFLLLARDDIGRALNEVLDMPFVGRLVAGSDGCAVLPGRVWLPRDAAPCLPDVLRAARARALSTDDLADAILWMEHLLATLSRIKPRYAFRPESLDRRLPSVRS